MLYLFIGILIASFLFGCSITLLRKTEKLWVKILLHTYILWYLAFALCTILSLFSVNNYDMAYAVTGGVSFFGCSIVTILCNKRKDIIIGYGLNAFLLGAFFIGLTRV